MATINTNTDKMNDIIDMLKVAPERDTSDATATASDILSGKTAYAKGAYVTGNIASKSSSNLTVSGATVSVPAGYYASNASKSVATTSVVTPTVSVSTSGLITASATHTAGYISSAATKTATTTMTTKAATTITPTTSTQTAVAANTYTTGAITVGAIPSSYVKPSATQAAKTWTPGTSNQTIAAGTYCSGAQTISGASTLTAGNIKTGVKIFGVTGTYAGPSGYVVPTATQAAKTWTPGTSNQTIAAGTYCSGAQTISGDSNLTAANIKSGIKIFGVTGTYSDGGSSAGSGSIVKSAVLSNLTIFNGYGGMGGSSGGSVTYGTSITQSNGVVSISGGTSATLSSSLFDTLKGKYVSIGNLSYAGGTRGVIWIPSDATVSGSVGYTSNVIASKAQYVFVMDAAV